MTKVRLFLAILLFTYFENEVKAYDFELDGIYYNVNSSSTNSVSVTYRSKDYKSYFGDIVIPDTVTIVNKKFAVTSIGQYAFNNCPLLTSIKLPKTIRSIQTYAFQGCYSLDSITIPNSVVSIGGYAFNHCTNLRKLIVEDGDEFLELGYNTKSWTQGETWGEYGQFGNCPIDTAYIGRNIFHSYAVGFAYTPFVGKINFIFGEQVTRVCSYFCQTSPASIKMLCKTPPTIDETSFRYTSGAKLYVPFPSLDLYKTTEIWNSFTDVEPFYTDYVATFIIDDTILEKLTITEGDTIIPPHAPEKEGHTFNGWKNIPELMPSENITVYGGYSVNNYKIIYLVDGEVYYTDDISYGAKIETIAEPEKEGYQFSGWKNVPDTMPAKDIVILGSFVEATSIEVPKHKEISSIKNSYDLNGKRISHTELKNNQIYILGGKKILRRK